MSKDINAKIIDAMLLVGMIVSVPSALTSLQRSIQLGFRPIFVVEVFVALVAIAVYVSRKYFSAKVRALVLFGYIFIIATFSIFSYGLLGLGLFIYLFLILVITSLFGLRTGIVTLGFAVGAYTALTISVLTGHIGFDLAYGEFANAPLQYIWRGVYFISFSAMGMTAIGMINKEQKRANEEIAISEERLSSVLKSLNEVVWDIDFVGNNNFISKNLNTVFPHVDVSFGKGIEQWRMLIHPHDLHSVDAAIQKLNSSSNQIISIEYRLKGKGNTWHWALTRGKVVKADANGKTLRVVGTHTNISSRKEMEQILRNSELQYRSLFVNAYDAILLITNGRIIDINEKALSFFNAERDEIIGKELIEFCPLTQLDGSLSANKLQNLISNAEKSKYSQAECEFLGNKNKIVYSSVSVDCFRENDINFFQVIIHDISDRMHFEKEKLMAVIETEERERLTLAANLHDDVGPLLSSLNMYLSLLGREQTNKQQAGDFYQYAGHT